MVSPPIYLQNSKSEYAWSRESFLKENYQYLVQNQDFASKIAKIATEKVIRGASQIKTDQDLHLLAETLDLSILQQDTFQTLENTTTKTQIIAAQILMSGPIDSSVLYFHANDGSKRTWIKGLK